MLHIILADSELETVPQKISSDKTLQRKAQKRGRKATELILDSNYYHKPMRKLKDSSRRGRPDIVHVCILSALDTPLNREGALKLYIHTRHDKVIDIDPKTRIPRSYNRFIGLMEQLFITKGVPPEDPLMTLSEKSLEKKINEINPDKTLAFTNKGRETSRNQIFSNFGREKDICAIIGGFPHDEFISNIEKVAEEILSIYPEPLDAVTVLNHIIQFYEEEFLNKTVFSER